MESKNRSGLWSRLFNSYAKQLNPKIRSFEEGLGIIGSDIEIKMGSCGRFFATFNHPNNPIHKWSGVGESVEEALSYLKEGLKNVPLRSEA